MDLDVGRKSLNDSSSKRNEFPETDNGRFSASTSGLPGSTSGPPTLSKSSQIPDDIYQVLKWQSEQILILQQQVKQLIERQSENQTSDQQKMLDYLKTTANENFPQISRFVVPTAINWLFIRAANVHLNLKLKINLCFFPSVRFSSSEYTT